MQIIIIFTIFFIIFSFMLLPIGLNVPKEPEKGHASSAPTKPRILKKLLISALISLICTGIFFYLLYKFPELEHLLKE